MDDFMQAITGRREGTPSPVVNSLQKNAVVISLESDDESDVEEIPREARWLQTNQLLPIQNSASDLRLEPSHGSVRSSTQVMTSAPDDRSQHADQERVPWTRSKPRITNAWYYSHTRGKWWSELRFVAYQNGRQASWISHIGRIMETDLGKQLYGAEKCQGCRYDGYECWVYRPNADEFIHDPGDECARCRAKPSLGNDCWSKIEHEPNQADPITTEGKPKAQEDSTIYTQRLPWLWTKEKKKTNTLYVPAIKGMWWSLSSYSHYCRFKFPSQSCLSHIARIMETELGEQKLGDDRCTNCQNRDLECWFYSEKGKKQVVMPGYKCARCRFHGRDLPESCTFSCAQKES